MSEKVSIFEKESAEKEQVSVSVTKEMKKKIQQQAKQYDLSVSYFCRKIFDIYFTYEKEINALADGKAKIVPVEDNE